MKKMVMGTLFLLSITLVGCTDTNTKSSTANTKSSSAAAKKADPKDFKTILNDNAHEYTMIINSMVDNDMNSVNKYNDNLNSKATLLEKQISNNNTDEKFSDDISKLASLYSSFSTNIKEQNFNISEISTQIGSLSKQIADSYYDGKLPEALQKFIDDNDKKKKEEEELKNKIYAKDEWWEVSGQWKLKVNSVRKTENRNSFSKKTPAEVVIVNYSYENLGYEGKIQDLYLTVAAVVDETGAMAETYPATDVSHSLTPTPIGAKCDGAEAAFALNNASGKVNILFSSYDSNSQKQTATFEVPVE